MPQTIERNLTRIVQHRLSSEPDLLQIITGPRQVGKTTLARTVADRFAGPVHYHAADLPLPPGPEWIERHWQRARADSERTPALLVLDEVQKVRGWSEIVKALWDEDRARGRALKVILLGSSALLLQQGSAESLAGRFFLHRCLHWTLGECQQAFGHSLEQYVFFGCYPAAAPLVDDERAWRAYVTDSLIETVLARDVLGMQSVAKPTLLRHLFALSARFPAQMLSYTKMLGQLTDAGNTTTLAHYLRLLESGFLLSGLERYSAGQARSRGSSPKLVCWSNALVSALNPVGFDQARQDPTWWGRLVESAVGAHLVNHLQALPHEVTYWRHRNDEVDFVTRVGRRVVGIEVKSGRADRLRGLTAFKKTYPGADVLVVGRGGMALEEFLLGDPVEMLG